MLQVRLVAVVSFALIGLGITSCDATNGATSTTQPDLADVIDFMGEVASAEFSEAWTIDPPGVALVKGGPDGGAKLGPQTIDLVGGPTLEVPMGTSGGNWCIDLIHPSQVAGITGDPTATIDDIPRFERGTDWTDPCVIMGRIATDGTVAWFQILDIEDVRGVDLAAVGSVQTVDTESMSVTTGDGYRFVLATDETDCGLQPSEVRFLTAFADWTTGQVVVLHCIDTA